MLGTYTIKQGDTLYKIAREHHISLDVLLAANPGVRPETLRVGQIIHVPGEEPHSPPSNSPGGNDIPGAHGGSNGGGGFIAYSGPASRFPPSSSWASYSALWAQNARLMRFHDTEDQVADIKRAIETVARSSRVDVRVILCIIVQESGGNVHVQTTNNGVRNPGIMQSHNGVEYDAKNSRASILQMVKDGTEGTKDGDGLMQLYKKYGNYYEAFRAYNSGKVDRNELNDPLGATADYVKNTANRLMGHVWDGM